MSSTPGRSLIGRFTSFDCPEMTVVSDSTFDPFGFLNKNFNIFGRGNGAWLEGKRPFDPLWPRGSAQFNHNVPIETANRLQILRDLYYPNGADGQPLFDPYNFAHARVRASSGVSWCRSPALRPLHL